MQIDDEVAFASTEDSPILTPVERTEPVGAPNEPTEAKVEPEAPKEAEGEKPAAEEPEKPKQTPWFQRRIDELTRERFDAQQRAERFEAELAAYRVNQPVSSQRPEAGREGHDAGGHRPPGE